MRKLIALSLILAASLAAAAPQITQKQLNATLHYWQNVLELQDWRISVEFIPDAQMPKGSSGMSQSDSALKMAEIVVLRPEDYALRPELPSGKRAIERDIEDTVVHELLHLRLKDLAGADSEHLKAAEECAVVRITTALLKLHHLVR